MRLFSLAASLGVIAALPAGAFAQAYQCRIPDGPVSLPDPKQDGQTREMAVTGYTLALSWSPEFCRFRKDQPRHARQCSGKDGRFGFVVHGLWPNGRGGNWPQYCPTTRQPSSDAVNRTLCTMPEAALIAREWVKHGSCMTPDPDAYLKVTRILWNSLRFPDFDRLSRKKDLTAGDIRETFAEANRFWEPEMIGLKLNKRGWLTEMRLCYGADFMPEHCDRKRYGPENEVAAKIWRGM